MIIETVLFTYYLKEIIIISHSSKQKTNIASSIIILLVILGFFFWVGATQISEISTFVGALLVALGGGFAVIQRTMTENGYPLKSDAVNFPIALVGVGGVIVAGGAWAPAWLVIKAFLGL